MQLRVVGVSESSQSLSYFLIGSLGSCALVCLGEGGEGMEKLKVLLRIDELGFEVHIELKNFVNTKFQNESSCELRNQSVLMQLVADQWILWLTA